MEQGSQEWEKTTTKATGNGISEELRNSMIGYFLERKDSVKCNIFLSSKMLSLFFPYLNYVRIMSRLYGAENTYNIL